MSKAAQRPFSIRIFVPDGDPDGLRLVEKSNWTGLGVVFKRLLAEPDSLRGNGRDTLRASGGSCDLADGYAGL